MGTSQADPKSLAALSKRSSGLQTDIGKAAANELPEAQECRGVFVESERTLPCERKPFPEESAKGSTIHAEGHCLIPQLMHRSRRLQPRFRNGYPVRGAPGGPEHFRLALSLCLLLLLCKAAQLEVAAKTAYHHRLIFNVWAAKLWACGNLLLRCQLRCHDVGRLRVVCTDVRIQSATSSVQLWLKAVLGTSRRGLAHFLFGHCVGVEAVVNATVCRGAHRTCAVYQCRLLADRGGKGAIQAAFEPRRARPTAQCALPGTHQASLDSGRAGARCLR
eukprot:s8233_g3.t1